MVTVAEEAGKSSSPPRLTLRPGRTVRDLLIPLFYFRRRVLVAFALPMLAAIALAFAGPRADLVDARLLVLFDNSFPSLASDRAQIVKAEAEVLRSPGLARETVRILGVRQLYPAAPRLDAVVAAERLRSGLSAHVAPRSNLIRVELRGVSPAVAARALDTLVSLYLQRRPALSAQLAPSSTIGSEADQEIARVESALSALAAEHHVRDLEMELSGAADQKAELVAVLQDIDRQIADRQGQVVQLRAQREGRPARIDVDQRLSATRTELAGLARRRAAAQMQLAAAESRLAELALAAPRYRQLAAERDALESGAAARAVAPAEASPRAPVEARVLQPARPAMEHHRRLAKILALGAVLGVLAASVVTLLSLALFEGMLTPFDVTRKLALPVILTLDEAKAPPALHDPLPLPAYMSAQDVQVLGEMLRRRTRRSNFSLQVVGADVGVGTTSLVADMALHAAREDRHVLILDMEPQALSPLDVLARRGARLEKMDGHGRAFRCAGSDLWVIRPPPQGENLSQRDWLGLIEQTCGDFDLVLVDAPPLTRSWQSVFAAPAVDVTLMVVEAEKTRAPTALNTIDRIAAAGGEVAGVILNRRRFHIPRAIYSRL